MVKSYIIQKKSKKQKKPALNGKVQILFPLNANTVNLKGKYYVQHHLLNMYNSAPCKNHEYLLYMGDSKKEVRDAIEKDYPMVDAKKIDFKADGAPTVPIKTMASVIEEKELQKVVAAVQETQAVQAGSSEDVAKEDKGSNDKNSVSLEKTIQSVKSVIDDVDNGNTILAYYEGEELCLAGAYQYDGVATQGGYTVKYANTNSVLKSKDFYAVSKKTNVVKRASNVKEDEIQDYIFVNGWSRANVLCSLRHNTSEERVYMVKEIQSNRVFTLDRKLMKAMIIEKPLLSSKYDIMVFSSKQAADKHLAQKKLIPEYLENVNFSPEATYIYTDGSADVGENAKECDCCGWAFVVYKNGKEVFCKSNAHPLRGNDKRATHLAEFLAVINAMNYAINNPTPELVILYDNVSVFNLALAESSSDIELFQKYTEYVREKWSVLEEMDTKITMYHVKSHSGIVGNEKADRLAREAVMSAMEYF